jgi:MATE family multidrug resistance protein
MPDTTPRPQAIEPTLGREIGSVARLAAPLSLAKMSHMVMAFVDTAMAGQVGREALGGLALANACYFTLFLFGLGIIGGLEPVAGGELARRGPVGARDSAEAGLWVGGVAGLFAALVSVLLVPTLLLAMGQDPAVVEQARRFLLIGAWGGIPALAAQAIIAQLTLHRANFVVTAAMATIVLVHVAINLVLVPGRFGLPALGIQGLAVSRLVGDALLLGILMLATRRLGRWDVLPVSIRRPSMPLVRQVLRYGGSIGVQFVLEVAAFNLVTVLMGRLGAAVLAGSTIALNVASFSFTLVMGVASAGAARVAIAIGQGDRGGARRSGWATLCLAWMLAVGSGAVMLLGDDWIVSRYTSDPEVAQWALRFMVCAVAFQLFDMTQGACFGVLRGAGDTRVPALFNIAGYWVVGLPLAFWLVFGLDRDPTWLWWGLTAGLMLIAVLLLVRFQRTLPAVPEEA